MTMFTGVTEQGDAVVWVRGVDQWYRHFEEGNDLG